MNLPAVNSIEKNLAEVQQMQKLCDMLMTTKHYQKLGQDGVFAIVAKAKSLNVDPLDALNGGLYYVQGKVGMSTEMMAYLIRQQGHSISKDPKSDDKIVILHGKRADNGDTWTVSFSWQDAIRAGLAKNMYERYPQIMLYNRAMSMLARQLFPDVIKGAGYTHDELKEIAGGNLQFADVTFSDLDPREMQSLPPKAEIPKLALEKVLELQEILAQVPDYKAKIEANLAQQKKSYEDITPEMYQTIYTTAYQKIQDGEVKAEVSHES